MYNAYIQECELIIFYAEPWLAFSPDGVSIKNSKPFGLLEIKCPYELENGKTETLLKKCKFLWSMANELSLKKRHQYYAQIQMGMALLNLQHCDFVIYSSVSNSIRIIVVALDEIYAENILKILKIK